jgi:hypothetical protein
MHLYWRIIEELKYLGETWIINDPSLKRRYLEWIRKNSESIALSFETNQNDIFPLFKYKNIPQSSN